MTQVTLTLGATRGEVAVLRLVWRWVWFRFVVFCFCDPRDIPPCNRYGGRHLGREGPRRACGDGAEGSSWPQGVVSSVDYATGGL